MSGKLLKEYKDLVSIYWLEEFESIYLKWHSEYDEGNRVVEAVNYALSYVSKNQIKHWWVDLSTSKNALKESDQKWVQSDFGKAIAESPLTKLAMTPPLPETGQDVDWLDEWEENTNAMYAGKISARLVREVDEVKDHFRR